jgi:hypothetical protein
VDLLSIQGTQISVSGATVYYAGVAIGTFVGGNGAPLRVNFLSNPAAVTVSAVQALVRSLTYRNSSQNFTPTTPRTLRITIEDGHGGCGVAMKYLTVVPVNDPPTLSTIAVLPGGFKNTTLHNHV